MIKNFILSLSITLFLFLTLSCTSNKKVSVITPSNFKSELRAPANPLINVDPYFSAWSFADNLNDDAVRHWTGKEMSLIGALRVDGITYRFLGDEKTPLKPILADANQTKWEGNYTFNDPKQENWNLLEYNNSSWKKGLAAFGSKNEPNLSTLWDTKDIWVRRTFNLDEDLESKDVFLKYSHDDIFELYINGVKIVDTGYTWKYNVMLELSDEVKATLKKGENIIAAHCHNRTGGAHVDFGLYEKEVDKESFANKAIQTSVNVLPTQTFYTFDCGPIELDVIFTAPLLMDDLDLLSTPINYLTYQVRSKDGNAHEVQVYIETTPQWAVNTDNQLVNFEKIEKNGLVHLKTGTIEQPILEKKGDDVRIDWGYFYLTGGADKSISMNIGSPWDSKNEFSSTGRIITKQSSSLSDDMEKEMTVLAYNHDLGNVSSKTVNGYVMLGYDDLYSIQYFKENRKAYWTKNGQVDIYQKFKEASDNYSNIMDRCAAFNEKMIKDAEIAGGKKYAELCALVYRHVISAHKLITDDKDNLIFLSKENFSNGSVGTVDLTYPSSPLFLLYNPDLLKGMMNPIFYFSESGKWTKPFSAHDVGTYPIANGQTYGTDMPIEESGNMLILTAAIATVEGNADYANLHWDVLTTWTDYLVEEGLDPDNQLCTDDFAGHFAHNANLSIKAIMGIASYGRLAKMLGKDEVAEKYMNIAKGMAVKWEQMANDGDHYRLTFDRPDTWSQKYNLVWDRLLGYDIFDPKIAETEVAYYLTKQNEYGLPLDNRATYTKTDWIIWSAVLTGNNDDFEALFNPVYKYADETIARIPISDWHDTHTTEVLNFRARSVVGAYFMKVLEKKLGKDK